MKILHRLLAAGALLVTAIAHAAPTLSNALVFSHFQASLGSAPVQAGDGNYYAILVDTGSLGGGSVVRIASGTGAVTRIYTFPSRSLVKDAANSLVLGADGALYGVTRWGGILGNGGLFRITTAGVHTTLVDFDYSVGGVGGMAGYVYGDQFYNSRLTVGGDGAIYGLGVAQTALGTFTSRIYKYTAAGGFSVVTSFADPMMAYPYAAYGLTVDSAGTLYGLASKSLPGINTGQPATVFRYRASDELTVLGTLAPAAVYAQSRLVIGADGRLYGIGSVDPGVYDNSQVRIYAIDPATGVASVFANFAFQTSGARPLSDLLVSSDGSLYGMTLEGGQGGGAVYQVSTSGVMSMVKAFPQTVGSFLGGIGLNSAGNFVGYTEAYFAGSTTVLTISRTTGATATLAIIPFSSNGNYPGQTLAPAADGGAYGTTQSGGPGGSGTIFRIARNGKASTEKAFAFDFAANAIFSPYGGLVPAGDGTYLGAFEGQYGSGGGIYRFTPGSGVSLVGMASAPGVKLTEIGLPLPIEGGCLSTFAALDGDVKNTNGGVAFWDTAGNLTVRATLDGATTGKSPRSLVAGPDGNYYGAASAGGANGAGTIFKVTPAGVLSLAATFHGPTTGSNPIGQLALAADGRFYGVTSDEIVHLATLFRFDPIAGTLTKLVDIDPASIGSFPMGGLTAGADGFLYGATSGGGAGSGGTIFRATTTGVITALADFDPNANGLRAGTVLRVADGSLYAATPFGGPTTSGTIVRFGEPLPRGNVATPPAPPKLKGRPKIVGNKAVLIGKLAPGAVVECARGKTTAKFKKTKAKGAKWTTGIPLKPGKNIIYLRATDPATGLSSTLKKVVVTKK